MSKTLVGGPQDGAKIEKSGDVTWPDSVFVGRKWLGDGFAAWSRKPSKRFPAEYKLVGFKFIFDRWHK